MFGDLKFGDKFLMLDEVNEYMRPKSPSDCPVLSIPVYIKTCAVITLNGVNAVTTTGFKSNFEDTVKVIKLENSNDY